jgi:hypothetical protein
MPDNAPVAVSVVFSKDRVKPGEEILATVTYSAGTAVEESTFTGTIISKATGLSSEVTGTFSVEVPDPEVEVSAADTGGRVWTKVSDDGSTVVWAAKG